MKAHLIDTHLLVPRSRSSAKVKVKYQGHVSQKMGVSGALVFHKHILFFFFKFGLLKIKIRLNKIARIYIIFLFRQPFNCLPNDKKEDLIKLKAFADDKFNVAYMMISVSDREENIVGKGENVGYQHFVLF